MPQYDLNIPNPEEPVVVQMNVTFAVQMLVDEAKTLIHNEHTAPATDTDTLDPSLEATLIDALVTAIGLDPQDPAVHAAFTGSFAIQTHEVRAAFYDEVAGPAPRRLPLGDPMVIAVRPTEQDHTPRDPESLTSEQQADIDAQVAAFSASLADMPTAEEPAVAALPHIFDDGRLVTPATQAFADYMRGLIENTLASPNQQLAADLGDEEDA